MSRLHNSLRPSTTTLSSWWIVVGVILLQAALLLCFFYVISDSQLHTEFAELALLLAYSAIAIGAAIYVAIMRHRWIQREDRVRQRLLDVIDAIPDPSAVRDVKGKYIMWNKAAEDYHGIKTKHVVGKTPFDLFPKEVAREILELDAQCTLSNSTVISRVVLPPLYGKGQRIASMRVAPVQSATDLGIRGVVTILHDITEIEREASAARRISAQLKMALDTSGFGSWTFDLESDYVTYSAQYQALMHYAGSSFQQDFVFATRIHPGDSEAVIAAVKHTLKEGIVFDQVFRMHCFDEVYRVFHASGEIALDDKGHKFFAGLLCPLDRSAD